MLIDLLDGSLGKIPVFKRYYLKRAAKLKRSWCLLLHRMGLLKPYSFVQWLATYKCNFYCPYCEASAGKAAGNELTTDEVRELIADLSAMGVKRFLISGGEPLVRPDLVELMQYANGFKMDLALVSNGFLVEDMWDELKGLKYFLYFTSIDGVPEYNDRVRGREGAFTKAMKGLELFGRSGVRTRMINTVVHPGNIEQLEQMLGMFKDSGANLWHLTPTASVGRAAGDSKFTLNGEQLKYLLEFIKRNRDLMKIDLGESHTYLGCFGGGPVGKPFFCGAGLSRCSIMPDGEVMGCQQAYDNTLTEGNIRDRPLSRIWKEEFTRFREGSFHDYCTGCDYIHSCQGGCWAEMEKHGKCLKQVWENDR